MATAEWYYVMRGGGRALAGGETGGVSSPDYRYKRFRRDLS